MFCFRLLNADAATHNCFAFVPGPSWSVVLPYESSRASLGLDISKSGQSTLDCLESQKASSLVSTTSLLYQLTLHRDGWEDEGRAQVEASPLQLLSSMQLTHEDLFRYLILRGNYSVRFDLCQREAAASADVSADTQAAPESLWSLTASAPGCETLPEEESVVSDEVASVTKARVNEACLMEKQDRNVRKSFLLLISRTRSSTLRTYVSTSNVSGLRGFLVLHHSRRPIRHYLLVHVRALHHS